MNIIITDTMIGAALLYLFGALGYILLVSIAFHDNKASWGIVIASALWPIAIPSLGFLSLVMYVLVIRVLPLISDRKVSQ